MLVVACLIGRIQKEPGASVSDSVIRFSRLSTATVTSLVDHVEWVFTLVNTNGILSHDSGHGIASFDGGVTDVWR